MRKRRIAVWVVAFLFTSGASENLAQEAEAPLSTADIVEAVGRATVTLRCLEEGDTRSGSGFIVDPVGILVTNHHVVHGCDRVQAELANGDVYEVIGVFALDPQKDLAILRIGGFNLPAVELGDSDVVRPGDRIIVIGNPLGILEGSVTEGVVSGIRDFDGLHVFQMDAAASPGNSGGPVADSAGRVVGVTTWKLTAGESLNFAVPINYARGLLAYDQRLALSSLHSDTQESLFGTDETGSDEDEKSISGRWRSLASNTVMLLQRDGDYVTGRVVEGVPDEGSVLYDLERQSDGTTFKGKVRVRFTCSYWNVVWGVIDSTRCAPEREIQLKLVTEDRLEGWIVGMQPQSDKKKDVRNFCKSLCTQGKRVREEFVWVREE